MGKEFLDQVAFWCSFSPWLTDSTCDDAVIRCGWISARKMAFWCSFSPCLNFSTRDAGTDHCCETRTKVLPKEVASWFTVSHGLAVSSCIFDGSFVRRRA